MNKNSEMIIERIKLMLELRKPKDTALSEIKKQENWEPFKVLIGTILSHRTKDEVTSLAVERLFKKYRNPKELSKAKADEVAQIIKPVGFYNQKTKSIIKIAKIINEKYNGKVPRSLDELLTLPSVGRKTANCVLVYGYNEPAIPVDTHVHRISNRLGLVKTKDPYETERELAKKLDKKYWIEINELFVRFGKSICKPLKPSCQICLLKELCDYYKANYIKER
ncbi:MAG: endonuclease III [Nitrososphaerales archaeon]